jgi:hypothetical protein
MVRPPKSSRREFLAASCASVAGMALFNVARAATPASTRPAPCPPVAWKKHGLVIEGTQPWEGGSVQNFTCPAEPLKGDAWRLWYSAVGGERNHYTIAYADGVPGGKMTKVQAELSPDRPADAPFAVGNLPAGWHPVQPVHLQLSSGKHRLYFWAHGPQVVRYLAAESDDGQRYRVLDPLRPVLYHPSDRAAWGVPSLDGIVAHAKPATSRPADEPLAVAKLISNDATNVYQLPDGTFEMYSVGIVQVPKGAPGYIAADNAPGWLRFIDRYVSADGLHFEGRRRIISRDAADPADQQFYYLSVTHTPKGRVGILGHYRVAAQTMDMEWCFSADGLKWERPLRSAWLPRGEKSQPDSYGVYAGHNVVHHAGQYHLFYTGVNYAHNGKDAYGPPRQVVMHATADSIWG